MYNESNHHRAFCSPPACGKKCVLSCLADMDFDGNRYYTINRVMLSCIGLWPYQNSPWSLGIHRFCCLVGFLTFLICQVLWGLIYGIRLRLIRKMRIVQFLFSSSNMRAYFISSYSHLPRASIIWIFFSRFCHLQFLTWSSSWNIFHSAWKLNL